MRRTLFITTFLTLPLAVWAEEFPLPAPVTEAEVYLQGALLVRTGQIDLPAGEHRLLVPVGRSANGLPNIDLTGASLGTVETLPGAIADGRRFLTPPQQAAYDIWVTAQEAAGLVEDARMRAAAAVKAAGDQLAFLRSITGSGLDVLDAGAMLATLDVLGERVQEAEVARAAAQAALRAADRAVRDAGLILAQARIDMDATGAQLGKVSLLVIGVTVAEAGTVGLTMETFTPQAGWGTRYDATLEADDSVTLERKVEVWQGTGLPLVDVALSLSTADPFAQTAPQEVFPNQASLAKPEAELQVRRSLETAPQEMDAAAEISMAAPASEPVFAKANFDGPVVTYDYPTAVSLPSTGGSVTLTLDTQSLDARVFNRASPRTDETAFLMAEVTNTTGEPLLPGPAALFRDGARIGESFLPLMPAGDEVELAFGPQQHLRLEFVRLENETGDRGLIFTSGTRQQDMVFRVRNLSDATEVVETRFALPYSEEEDLQVDVSTRPDPDERNVEDKRGVAQWNLDVPAREEVEVTVGVTLEWPEGETLNWQP